MLGFASTAFDCSEPTSQLRYPAECAECGIVEAVARAPWKCSLLWTGTQRVAHNRTCWMLFHRWAPCCLASRLLTTLTSIQSRGTFCRLSCSVLQQVSCHTHVQAVCSIGGCKVVYCALLSQRVI